MLYLGHVLCNRHKCGTRYYFMTLAESRLFYSSYIRCVTCTVNLRGEKKKRKKEGVKTESRVKQADGGSSMSLFSPCQAFELHTPGLLYTFRDSAEWDNKHRHTNPAKPPLSLPLFPLFLDWTLLHLLSASFTVWIFLLFIEEGFALAQKIKGKTDVSTVLLW